MAESGSPHSALEQRIALIGRALQQSLQTLLDSVPGGMYRPLDVTREFGVNKDLASKLLLAIRKEDPLACAYFMPGPEALRRLIKAAQRRRFAVESIAEVRRALADFETLIAEAAGDRAGLNSIISAWIPDIRARFELGNKQGAFKHTANLKGITADVGVCTFFASPSTAGDRHDVAFVQGYVGLRRLRQGVVVHLSNGTQDIDITDHEFLTFDGEPLSTQPHNTALTEFCSRPLPTVEATSEGKTVHFVVSDDAVGLASSMNVFFGGLLLNYLKPVTSLQHPRDGAFSAEIEIPCKTLLFDVLIHDEVWPGPDPRLIMYDTTVLGCASPNDRTRDASRLNLMERIQPLGHDVSDCRSSLVNNYVDILRHVCERRGWNERDFRCFRCLIQYPFYGSQVHMVFSRVPV